MLGIDRHNLALKLAKCWLYVLAVLSDMLVNQQLRSVRWQALLKPLPVNSACNGVNKVASAKKISPPMPRPRSLPPRLSCPLKSAAR